MIKSTQDYFNYEVNTQISTERLSSIEFPSVTFCNKNILKINNNTDPKVLDGLIFLKKLLEDEMNETLYSGDLLTKAKYYITFGMKKSFSKEELFNSGYQIDEMLIYCKYNGIRCAKNEFEYFYKEELGNCYKFNSGINLTGSEIPKKRLSTSGKTNGLRLELYLGYPSVDYSFLSSTGALIFIHNSSSKYLSDKEGISVPIGFMTDIGINQVFINKLPKPFGNCIENVESLNGFNSDFYRLTVQNMNKYEQKYCLQFCYQSYLISKCNCYDVTFPNLNATPCQLDECVTSTFNSFYSSDLSLKCFDSCPPECNSIEYNFQLSHSDFPSPYYSNILIKYDKMNRSFRNYTTYNEVRSSVLAVNVYYNDIAFTIIDEVPSKSTAQFFSELGGILGLYIGVSLLSFVEILEMGFKIFQLYFLDKFKETSKAKVFFVK